MVALDDGSVREAALRLRRARASGQPCAPVRDLVPDTWEAGYAVQNVNTNHWLQEGRTLVGRKIGLTSAAVQNQLGVDRPDYGMLYADMARGDGEPIAVDTLLQPRVEAEIAFFLRKDLDGPRLTPAEVIDAIDYAVAAIEIVDSAVENWNISVVDTVADNASSGLYVLGGSPRRLGDFDPWLCGMVMERRGEPICTGVGAACLGHPLTATLWLARQMQAVERPLRAGDLVLSGALGPLVAVEAGDVIEARINRLGTVRAAFAPKEGSA